MPWPLPMGRESPVKPGEMPGLPQLHLASCRGMPERETLGNCVHFPVGRNAGLENSQC